MKQSDASLMKRADSLDALRGLTIAMMTLCGTIITTVLPLWNSHAQVPPTGFDPTIYGITWVDLVFPFFLFSMGAAIPFATASRLEKGHSRLRLAWDGIWRGIKLAFFAIFIQNMYPWVLSQGNSNAQTWATTLTAFLVLFPLFMRLSGKPAAWIKWAVPSTGVVVACGMMWMAECAKPLPDGFVGQSDGYDVFLLHINHILSQSNIIILILANMAAFGALIYIVTASKPMWRLGVLPLLMAILLCSGADGSWQQTVYNWTPAPWLYQFTFLRYLFIIIPGTIAGEYLREWISGRKAVPAAVDAKRMTVVAALLALVLIAVNVTLLYGRHLVANLWVSAAIVVAIICVTRRVSTHDRVLNRLAVAGGYLLMTGLFFEAFEGGIRKDDPTFSYFFVTGGLAFYCLAMLIVVCDILHWHKLMSPFTLAGKNPMVAYVAPTMLIYPVMNLMGVGDSALPFWSSNWALGLGRGLLFTAIAVAAAALLAKKKIVWRT